MWRLTRPFGPNGEAFLDVHISKAASVYEPHECHASLFCAKMLVDTGASRTSLSRKIAHHIGLLPLGKYEMRTAGGLTNVNKLFSDIIIPCDETGKRFDNREIMELQDLDNWYDGILGRDILSALIFEYHGPRREFSISSDI